MWYGYDHGYHTCGAAAAKKHDHVPGSSGHALAPTASNDLATSESNCVGDVSTSGSKPGRGVTYGQLFYQSPPLETGQEHALVISNTLPGKNMIWLDFLQIHSGKPPPIFTPSDPEENGMASGSALLGVLTLLPVISSILLRSFLRTLVKEL